MEIEIMLKNYETFQKFIFSYTSEKIKQNSKLKSVGKELNPQ